MCATTNKPNKAIRHPFFLPINIERYKAATSDLSTAEHGALLLLHMHYWRTGPLADSDTTLARIAGSSTPEWKKIRPRLERFFEIDRGTWINYEWDEELETAHLRIDKSSKAGSKAANARWGRMRAQSETDANRMPAVSDSDAMAMQTISKGGGPLKTPCPAREAIGFSSLEDDSMEHVVAAAEVKFRAVHHV